MGIKNTHKSNFKFKLYVKRSTYVFTSLLQADLTLGARVVEAGYEQQVEIYTFPIYICAYLRYC